MRDARERAPHAIGIHDDRHQTNLDGKMLWGIVEKRGVFITLVGLAGPLLKR
jgi:hypothetical protein